MLWARRGVESVSACIFRNVSPIPEAGIRRLKDMWARNEEFARVLAEMGRVDSELKEWWTESVSPSARYS